MAVYINWRFVGEGKNFILADSRAETETKNGERDGYEHSDTDSYFDNAKYLRKKNYNESVAVLSEIVNNDNTDSETRKLAADTITSYIEISQHEQTIENLISAKGFKECVVFLNSDNATVVVESDGLTQAQAAQIMDTVASETKFPYDVIKIIEIGSVQK